MTVAIEDFKTGWFGIQVGLTDSDIALLIERLQALQQHRSHFHFRRDAFTDTSGVADVELYWTDQAPSNMLIE